MEKVISQIRNIVKKQGTFRPLLVTDIDGVLVRGSIPIPGTKEALLALKQSNIPITCLTNGGGML
jgi:ribonucleotide monophosphatase NagD (HAD superfamily)